MIGMLAPCCTCCSNPVHLNGPLPRRQIVNVFKPHGTNGVVSHVMEHVLRCMKANQQVLLGMMDVFVREPLLDWQHASLKSQRYHRGESDSPAQAYASAKVRRSDPHFSPSILDPASFLPCRLDLRLSAGWHSGWARATHSLRLRPFPPDRHCKAETERHQPGNHHCGGGGHEQLCPATSQRRRQDQGAAAWRHGSHPVSRTTSCVATGGGCLDALGNLPHLASHLQTLWCARYVV